MNNKKAASEELDLIDVISSIWSWRRLLIFATLLGGVIAFSVWKRASARLPIQHGDWVVRLKSVENDSPMSEASAKVLERYLNTTEGGADFFNSLLSASPDASRVNNFLQDQLHGRGVVRAVGAIDGFPTITFSPSLPLSKEAVLESAPRALEELIGGLSRRVIVPALQSGTALIQMKVRLAEIKIEAARLADQYSGLSSTTKSVLVQRALGSVVDDSDPTAFLNLLGAIPPSHRADQTRLLAEFRTEIRNFEALQLQLKTFEQTVDNTSMLALSPVGKMTTVELTEAPSDAPEKSLSSTAAILLGMATGLAFAMTIALIARFVGRNRLRIAHAFKGRLAT